MSSVPGGAPRQSALSQGSALSRGLLQPASSHGQPLLHCRLPVSPSVSHTYLFQPPRADQTSDSDRQMEHAASHANIHSDIGDIHKIMLPKEVDDACTGTLLSSWLLPVAPPASPPAHHHYSPPWNPAPSTLLSRLCLQGCSPEPHWQLLDCCE